MCDFIANYQGHLDSDQPKWREIVDHLNDVGCPTARGSGRWAQSSAQAALVRYCRGYRLDYPLTQRRWEQSPKAHLMANLGSGGETKESTAATTTITITITLLEGQKVSVVVE
jgi:hypothetical protein